LRPYIELEHVEKSYRLGTVATRALHDLTFSLARGSFNAIVGPSGCGKSTLLTVLGALDRPDGGAARVGDLDLARADAETLTAYRRETIGFVFQSYNLLRSLTALENVEMSLAFSGLSPRDRRARAVESLERVGLAEMAGNLPRQLSGGQQQRVSIARAVARRPALLLADEPTGNLDRESGARVFSCLLDLQRDLGVTCVMVTHDPDLAARADRTIRMHDGRVVGESAVPPASVRA